MMRTTILATAACLPLAACQQTTEVVDANRPAPQCFSVTDFRTWRATPDGASMYVRAGLNRFYRVDFAGTCPALNWPGAFLITTFRGQSNICSKLDWDLKVAETGGGGIAVPCIVDNMTPLTPAEAAAIPDRYRP